jgi:tetratricopeptide (TPR) repeat protein
MKTIIASLLLLCWAHYQQTNHFECDETMYKAYLGHQDVQVSKAEWKKIVAARKTKFQTDPKNQDNLYDLSLAQFGLLTSTMRDQDENLFDEYVDETEENLQTLIDGNKKWGEPRALLAALYGLKISYSPMKGMFYGSKSGSLMDQAKKDAPTSPLVCKLYANSKFFTPDAFGGDLKEAIKSYEKSIQLYKSAPESTKNNWFYLDTMAFLGQAYLKDGQTAKAIETYDKALKIEPGYSFVKFNLLPKAKKTASSN